MATIAQLATKVAQFLTASDKAHAIVNGADDATVTVDSGVLPTMAKAIKDFQDEGAAAIDAIGGTPVSNYSAETDPSAGDDETFDYSIGSLWINIVTREAYRCVDATEGAAVWIESTLDAAEVTSLIAAGFTMDAGADINFANASRLREGLTDAGNGGAGGIAMVCSLDYEFKWEAGRLYVMGQDGFTIRVEQYGFTSVPTTTDDDTKGYIVGSRRILDDGSIYLCTDATEDAAVWQYQGILDIAGLVSINQDTRQLIGTDGVTVALDWSNPSLINIASGVYLGVDVIYDSDSPNNYVDIVNGEIGAYSGTYSPRLDWIDRTLHNAAGDAIAKWGEDNSTGNYGIAFGPDGMGTFYHLLNADGLAFLSESRYGTNTIDYNGTTAIDVQTRQLIANDGSTVMLDWSNPYSFTVGTDLFVSSPYRVVCGDATYVYMSPDGIGNTTGLAIDVPNYQLIGNDGELVMLDWSDSTNGTIDAKGNHFKDIYNLADASDAPSVYVNDRQLSNEDGTTIASWSNIYGVIGLSIGDGQRYIGIDSTLRFYDGTAHVDMVDWSSGLLRKSVGGGVAATTVDWVNSRLLDGYGTTCLDWSTSSPSFPQGATYNPTAVVSLPATPVEGTIAYVNDALVPVIGSAVANGGSAKCLVCYNGTSWIVTALL